MSKTTRARCTLEFKLEAIRLVKAGQSVAAVAATLAVPAQSISNWLKAEQEGELGGAGTKPVSPEQMELSRLRAEVAQLKMERDILKNRPTRLPASLMSRNSWGVHSMHAETVAVSFLEA